MAVIIARDQVREPFYVVVPVMNQWRWKSRWKHTDRAIKHFVDSGAVVVLVEIGFNRRELVYADSGLDGTTANCGIHGEFKHKYIGLHSREELWMKEPAINIGVQYITHTDYHWQQVGWLDSDVHFIRPNWVGEAIHKLQHGMSSDIAFLQMFTQARDLGPNYEMLPEDYPHANGVSFVKSWQDGDLDENLTRGWRPKEALAEASRQQILADLAKVQGDVNQLSIDLVKLEKDIESNYYGARRVFPGLAWACTRKAWDAVGGLPDFAIWGGADWAMAHALIGRRRGMMHSGLHDNYKAMMNAWADNADRHVRQNVMTMDGAIFHNWHGKKTVRGYGDKHRILAKLQFDPIRHLKRDGNGLPQLHDDGSETFTQLRDSFRKIAHERNEDSIDI
jgi:hypothetical protein